MRIVQVVPDFGLGGIQKGGIVLANSLSRLGQELHVVGMGPGPRYLSDSGSGPVHHILNPNTLDAFLSLIDKLRPDVLHLHRLAFPELTLGALNDRFGGLLVMTPVFGRPPENSDLLKRCKVCLVGTFAFNRFIRWLEISMDEAIATGIGYVPITPYEAPQAVATTLDPPPQIKQRRHELGVPEGMLVFGRIGRQHLSKWHPDNVQLIESLLHNVPGACWMSVGFPNEYHPQALRQRFGERFIHFDEIADANRLGTILASMDIQLMFGRGECFASTISEAAGVGVPTIALATPLLDNGQAEQVIDGVTGYLVGNVRQAIDRSVMLASSLEQLHQLKQSSYHYAHENWLADKAAKDLLELYEFWHSGDADKAPYLSEMRRKAREFHLEYRRRMVKLMSNGPVDQMLWRMRLAAVESWPLFKMARLAKRLCKPGLARELRKSQMQWY